MDKVVTRTKYKPIPGYPGLYASELGITTGADVSWRKDDGSCQASGYERHRIIAYWGAGGVLFYKHVCMHEIVELWSFYDGKKHNGVQHPFTAEYETAGSADLLIMSPIEARQMIVERCIMLLTTWNVVTDNEAGYLLALLASIQESK